ncbi:MAG TPA: hypothetical protein VIO94_16085 [Phenylobacterium sp.]
MSLRTLLEINHDAAITDDLALLTALRRYVSSASPRTAAELERFGVKVVGMRHHSSAFVVPEGTAGFPVALLPVAPREDGQG